MTFVFISSWNSHGTPWKRVRGLVLVLVIGMKVTTRADERNYTEPMILAGLMIVEMRFVRVLCPMSHLTKQKQVEIERKTRSEDERKEPRRGRTSVIM